MQRTVFFILATFIFSQVYTQNLLEGKRVLWIGTSIPAHCSYPKNACESLGMTCRNHSIGASFLSIRPFNPDEEIESHTGYALSMSSDEKEELYHPWLEEGRITRHQLDVWKFSSYDSRIIEYLDSTDIIVIDHGFNDANNTLQAEYERGIEAVDWNSEDRSTFIGAFNYVYNRIKEIKPEVIIAIGGYFQNTSSVMPRGRYVSEVSTWIAEHYDLPLFDVWNYADVPDGFVPNSADYFDNLNTTYGTNFHPIEADEEGNISYYQMFCPDNVHPWSDPTGHSDHVLDSIFTEIMPSRLEPYFRSPHLMFNELMTNNIETLLYNHHYPDSWFELYNPTSREINLRNWRISNRNDYPTAYIINHFKYVPAEGYAIICCDGRDDHWEHTDFTLDPECGGALYLWNPDGDIVDSIRYPASPGADVSYGRIRDDAHHWQFKFIATPEKTNISGGSTRQLPAPTISLTNKGIEISVEAFNAPADTYIYYTCDGSTPTLFSPHVPLEIQSLLADEESQVIKARLMSPYALPSPTVTRSFIHHPRQTSLPIISLSTDIYNLYSEEDGILVGSDWNDNCFKYWERPLYLEYFEPVDSLSLEDVQEERLPKISQQVQATTYGLGSLLFSQKSLEIQALNRFGNGSFDTSSFWPSKPQVQQARAFLLRNGGDRALDTRIEDAFVQELFGQHVEDIEYQAYRPVIVYINGQYKGIYELRESEDKAWMESNKSIASDDITLIKSLTSEDGSYKPVLELIANDDATLEDYSRLIDIPLFINYLCAETFATNDNFPHNNITLWRNEALYPSEGSEGGFHALLRNLDYVSTTSNSTNWLNYLTCFGDDAVAVHNREAHQIFIRLLNLPEFRDAYIDRMMVYLGDFCKPSVTLPMVNRMREEIADEVAPTFDIMTESPDYERNFVKTIDERLTPYCEIRPLLLCGNLNSTFHLDGVYLMTVQGADSINGIRLTEGDFDGCCFYTRPVTLSTDSLNGWELTVMHTDSTIAQFSFLEPKLSILPSSLGTDLDSLGFTAKPLSEFAGIRDIYADPVTPSYPSDATHGNYRFRIPQFYDLLGRPTEDTHGILLQISPDGTRKLIRKP